MTKQIRWVGLALMVGVFLGFFALQQETGDNWGLPNEMKVVEVETIEAEWEASDFAALWRNAHGTRVTQSDETSAESDNTRSVSGGIWRLVGVVAISGEKVAYLMSPENKVVVVREGEEFGEDHHVTEIKKKSVSYKDPESESYLLSLYPKRTEVEL